MRERAEYEGKMADRAAEAARQARSLAVGCRGAGRGAAATDQVNITMKTRGSCRGGRRVEQCYDAQAAVAADGLLVVAADVVPAPNDEEELSRCWQDRGTPAELGKVGDYLPTTAISASKSTPRRRRIKP